MESGIEGNEPNNMIWYSQFKNPFDAQAEIHRCKWFHAISQ